MSQEWTRKIEREIDTLDFQDGRSLSGVILSELIERYSKEMQIAKPFGRNKTDVLTRLKKDIGALTIPEITSEKLMEHIKARQQVKPDGTKGAGGVTISVELTYLGSVFRAAKQLWKMPINLDIISETRANLKYMGLRTKSTERDRRPTELEIKQICDWFIAKGPRQKVPMPDLIHFAITTAMRAGEIINLKWDDLNDR